MAAASVIVPSLMVMKGSALGPVLWRWVVNTCLVASLGFLSWTWGRQLNSEATRFAISAAMLAIAFVVLRTVGFAMITIFRQRMKARREAYLAEIRAIKGS